MYERTPRFLIDHHGRVRDEEFERLYSEHAPSLYAFLVYRTGDGGLAEDVLADAFERALRARFRFDRRRGSEKTWLYSIALNCLRDHARRRGAEQRALERAVAGADEPIAGTESVERRDLVERALSALSDEEREAVSLRYGAELTLPEMSRLTGEPVTTMEGRLYRALRKMRNHLSNGV